MTQLEESTDFMTEVSELRTCRILLIHPTRFPSSDSF
jgi:hypothetical protein